MNRLLSLIAICLMMASCHEKAPAYKAKLDVAPEPYDLEFDRYEDVLFNLDTADFQNELMRIQDRYQLFLSGDLNDLDAVRYLKDFATDPFSIVLYNKVKAAFPDLKQVEPIVEDVLAHFHHYYPSIELPRKVFTCVTGVNYDEPPVQLMGDQMVISLDWYLGNDEVYDQIGMPRYMALRCCLPTLESNSTDGVPPSCSRRILVSFFFFFSEGTLLFIDDRSFFFFFLILFYF